MQREGERFAKTFERVDDMSRTEGGHVGRGFAIFGAAQRWQFGREQASRDGNGQVCGVVVRQRDDTGATGMGEACIEQEFRVRSVSTEGGYVGCEALQLDLADLRFVEFEHDRAQPHAIKRMTDKTSGLAVTTDDIEGLAQTAHRAHKALCCDGLPHAAVRKHSEYRA